MNESSFLVRQELGGQRIVVDEEVGSSRHENSQDAFLQRRQSYSTLSCDT